MATVGDVQTWLESVFPPALAEDWDNVGLQVGDLAAPAERVTVALDPTRAVVDAAVSSGTQLLVTHHPLIFRPLSCIETSRGEGAVIAAAIRGGCAVTCAHTNADAALGGVADSLADILGIVGEREPLIAQNRSSGGGGLGRCGALERETSVGDLARHVASVLHTTPRIVGDASRPVRRLAVCGGSGAEHIDAAHRAGADAYVTGDVKHHAALAAIDLGIPVIDAGHHATEVPWVPITADRLRSAFPKLDVYASVVRTDPFQVPA